MTRLLAFPFRIGFKLISAAALIGVGAFAFGDLVKPIRELGVGILGGGVSQFDPGLQGNDVAQLELLRKVHADITPELHQVESAIRQAMAEAAYLTECRKSLEHRLSPSELASLLERPSQSASDASSRQARLWLAYQMRISQAEQGLDDLSLLRERVLTLQGRLDRRRQEIEGRVLGGSPSAAPMLNAELADSPLARARQSLEASHERLFKVAWAIGLPTN